MHVVPFEDLRVTTMTLVMSLDGTVKLPNAFDLMPVTKITIDAPKKKSKKCKPPHIKVPGAILSMRYRGRTRGIIRSAKKSYFKNSITIDIDADIKNISAKLSPGTIQMCGAVSEDNGRQAATYIINHLHNIEDMLQYIQRHQDDAKRVIEFLSVATRDQEVPREVVEQKHVNQLVLNITRNINDFTLKTPEEIPEEIDQRICSFFLGFINDFMYNTDYIQKLEWIMTVDHVIDKPLSVVYVHNAMVNYNYSLGFQVNRHALNQLINRYDGFLSRYDNVIEHNVTVESTYTPIQNPHFNHKTKKIPRHIFLVYISGLVTQSGPGGERMKEAYYRFMNAIAKFEDEIMLK